MISFALKCTIVSYKFLGGHDGMSWQPENICERNISIR